VAKCLAGDVANKVRSYGSAVPYSVMGPEHWFFLQWHYHLSVIEEQVNYNIFCSWFLSG
jgi:hypothetical protein